MLPLFFIVAVLYLMYMALHHALGNWWRNFAFFCRFTGVAIVFLILFFWLLRSQA